MDTGRAINGQIIRAIISWSNSVDKVWGILPNSSANRSFNSRSPSSLDWTGETRSNDELNIIAAEETIVSGFYIFAHSCEE